MSYESIIARSWGADDMKKRQTALTKTINTMRKQADWFKGSIPEEERQQIEAAIATFTRLRDATAHAKEVQARKDKKYELDKKTAAARIRKLLSAFHADNKTRYLMAFHHELEGLPKNIEYIQKMVKEDRPVWQLQSSIKHQSEYFIQEFCRGYCSDFVAHEDSDQDLYPRAELNNEEIKNRLDKELSELPKQSFEIADQLDGQIARMEAIENSDKVTRLKR
jgi:membrane-associated HD superfamily phosphohydrolase